MDACVENPNPLRWMIKRGIEIPSFCIRFGLNAILKKKNKCEIILYVFVRGKIGFPPPILVIPISSKWRSPDCHLIQFYSYQFTARFSHRET